MGIWTVHVEAMAKQNSSFLTVVHTGEHIELNVMSLAPREDVGTEVGRRVDQLIRVEQGTARLTIGKNDEVVDETHDLSAGSAVFIPEGIWHNIVNVGQDELKLFCIYSPPTHPEGHVHRTKTDWLAEKRDMTRATAETGAFGA